MEVSVNQALETCLAFSKDAPAYCYRDEQKKFGVTWTTEDILGKKSDIY